MKTALIFLVVGLTCWIFFGSPKKSDEKKSLNIPENSKQSINLKRNLETFTKIDLEEYVQLKDSAEKYQKADELLGKMMLLFLADLELNLSSKQKKWIKQSPFERRDKAKTALSCKENVPSIKTEESGTQFFYPDKKEPISENRLHIIHDPNGMSKYTKQTLLHNKKAKNKWLSFSDALKKSIKKNIPSDVYRQLWKNDSLYKSLKPVNLEQVKTYIGAHYGRLRNSTLLNEPVVFFKLFKPKLKENGKVKTRIQFTSDDFYLGIDAIFSIMHPKSHSSGGGPCRGMVLQNSGPIVIYLIKLQGFENQILGRITLKRSANIDRDDKVLGTFLLNKKDGK